MRDSFLRGLPGAGSHGDPRLDALLTEEVADRLLDGWPRHAALPPDLRPLRETVDALRAVPSRSELRAESLAMAAFREIPGPSLDDTIVDGPAVDAHTLRLEIPRDPSARPRRARHRARPAGRPAGHTAGPPRPALRRPRALGTAAALALVAIFGIFAYAGSLPGPIQNAAHDAFGAPPVKTAAPSAPSVEVTGSAREPASPVSGAHEVRPSATSGPRPSANAAPSGPRQWCQAYFRNPWRPGSTSWDKSDFDKLSEVAPGGPAWVLWYCAKYLDVGHVSGGTPFSFPANFPGGSWAWDPGRSKGRVPSYPGNVSDTGSTSQPGTFPGPAGGPGPAEVPGQDGPAGYGQATPTAPAGGAW